MCREEKKWLAIWHFWALIQILCVGMCLSQVSLLGINISSHLWRLTRFYQKPWYHEGGQYKVLTSSCHGLWRGLSKGRELMLTPSRSRFITILKRSCGLSVFLMPSSITLLGAESEDVCIEVFYWHVQTNKSWRTSDYLIRIHQ